MNRFQLLASTSLLTYLLGSGAPNAATDDGAGVATAAVPAIQALVDGQAPRSIAIGNEIFQNERIKTGPNGQLHVLLRDETNFTIGPNSDITIDEFVFDPTTSLGELAINQSTGVLRFVGGALSKTSPVMMRTPFATIGVRGGMAIIQARPAGSAGDDGGTDVFFLYGASVTVQSASGETAEMTQAGFSISVSASGEVSEPQPIDPAELAQVMAALESPSNPSAEPISETMLANIRDLLETPEGTLGDDGPSLLDIENLIGLDGVNEQQNRAIFEQLRDTVVGDY